MCKHDLLMSISILQYNRIVLMGPFSRDLIRSTTAEVWQIFQDEVEKDSRFTRACLGKALQHIQMEYG